eukprot:jgi/Picsp_1/377/NSC_00375-R1_---NA---
MVFVHVHATGPSRRLPDSRTKPLWRTGIESLRVRNSNKVNTWAREARACGSTIVFNSLFHEGSICRIEKLSRGIGTSVLTMVLCMTLDMYPCEAAYEMSSIAEGDTTQISSPLPSRSPWGGSRLYKKSYLVQALLQNRDGGVESSRHGSLVEEKVGSGEQMPISSTIVVVEKGNSAAQQAATGEKKETLEDQNAIKKKIKWLNEVTSQITEELNDTHPPPLKGHVEQARGKVSTELSAISGSMGNVASDLKEGFVGLKDTITSIASQESEKQKVSGSISDDDSVAAAAPAPAAPAPAAAPAAVEKKDIAAAATQQAKREDN